MLLLIDNYDSFTYNLAQYLGELGADVEVVRNDATSVDAIAAEPPGAIVISPGPCTPNEAGISMDVIRRFAGKVPILGVCLGHQCIGEVFGGHIVRAPTLMHGKVSLVHHDGKGVLAGLPQPFEATRYFEIGDRPGFCIDLRVGAIWIRNGVVNPGVPVEVHGHVVQLQDFVDSIREDRKPMVTGEDARPAVEIILAVYQSARTGQPVRLPLQAG